MRIDFPYAGDGPDEAERSGMRSMAPVQEAIDLALDRQGRDASVAVPRHGGHIPPLADALARGSDRA